MFNHTVIFWTNPSIEGAADELLAAMEGLREIPEVLHLSLGKPFQPSTPAKGNVDQRCA